jgi:hypothetical protein
MGCGFILDDMFTVFAAVSTNMSLNFPTLFFCEEHKRGEGIIMVLTRKSVKILGCKTMKSMELTDFLH